MEHIEQATAAPGEHRNVRARWEIEFELEEVKQLQADLKARKARLKAELLRAPRGE